MADIVGTFSIIFLTIAFFLFLLAFKNKGYTYKIFTFYLGIIACCELFCLFLERFIKNNLWVGHIDTIAQFVLLSLFFASMYKNKLHRKLVYFFTVFLTTILLIGYALQPASIFKYNNIETFSTSMLLIIYSVVHLYNLLNGEKLFFYVTVGLLIYLVGSTIIALTGNILIAINDLELFDRIWVFNNLSYLTYQFFTIFEWHKNYRKRVTLE
jgi:hypothetical protein